MVIAMAAPQAIEITLVPSFPTMPRLSNVAPIRLSIMQPIIPIIPRMINSVPHSSENMREHPRYAAAMPPIMQAIVPSNDIPPSIPALTFLPVVAYIP